ncbi:MAG: hypothetical protein ACRDRI_16260 [Pseudonocardiaceae bacterium]
MSKTCRLRRRPAAVWNLIVVLDVVIQQHLVQDVVVKRVPRIAVPCHCP